MVEPNAQGGAESGDQEVSDSSPAKILNWDKLRAGIWYLVSAPDPNPFPEVPTKEEYQETQPAYEPFETPYEFARELIENTQKRRIAAHEETSKTIRWVLRTLLGVCLFYVITLAGTPDAQLLTSDAVVELPGINYKLNFGIFLIIGPVTLIGFAIYLHIFVAQHLQNLVPSVARVRYIFNMEGIAPKFVTVLLFYYLVPATLAFFAWKALPRPFEGPLLYWATTVLLVAVLWLRIRRSRKRRRALDFLVLIGFFSVVIFADQPVRGLNLFKANLAGKDLRKVFLVDGDLAEANLDGANLEKAFLKGAYLRETSLRGANLKGANLRGAKLFDAKLEGG